MKMMREETLQTGLSPDDKKISEKMEINKYQENITVDELAGCELSWFRGEIVVADNLETFYKVFPRFLNTDLLGFDTETKPSFKKGKKNTVSLIQLSTENFACLFRINKIGIPGELIRFFPGGFIDLQTMVNDFGIQSSGLKKLSAIVLGFRISKRQQVTDWEAEQLSEAQRIYAATDAWVCHQIYKTLTNGKDIKKNVRVS